MCKAHCMGNALVHSLLVNENEALMRSTSVSQCPRNAMAAQFTNHVEATLLYHSVQASHSGVAYLISQSESLILLRPFSLSHSLDQLPNLLVSPVLMLFQHFHGHHDLLLLLLPLSCHV